MEEAKKEFDTGARHSDEMDGEVGSGAQIAWNTGLAEIALPIEFKLKWGRSQATVGTGGVTRDFYGFITRGHEIIIPYLTSLCSMAPRSGFSRGILTPFHVVYPSRGWYVFIPFFWVYGTSDEFIPYSTVVGVYRSIFFMTIDVRSYVRTGFQLLYWI